MCFKRLAFMLVASLATPARAEPPVSVGAAVTPTPALSLQYVANPDFAYHFTTGYGEEGARINADLQRLYMPSFGYGRSYRLSLYSGVGLAGESRREEEVSEEYRLRLPIGAQCAIQDMHLVGFLEVAGLVGPLPVTRVAGAYAGGIRATF